MGRSGRKYAPEILFASGCWASDGRAAVQGRGELRVLGWGQLRSLGRAAALPRLIGYKPLAFRKVEASGCFIPVKSVNISMGSLVLPRLMILSRKAWPTAGSRAPCLAK